MATPPDTIDEMINRAAAAESGSAAASQLRKAAEVLEEDANVAFEANREASADLNHKISLYGGNIRTIAAARKRRRGTSEWCDNAHDAVEAVNDAADRAKKEKEKKWIPDAETTNAIKEWRRSRDEATRPVSPGPASKPSPETVRPASTRVAAAKLRSPHRPRHRAVPPTSNRSPTVGGGKRPALGGLTGALRVRKLRRR